MSPSLTSRSPDLRRLREEGYDIEVVAGHLVVRDVPYVTPDGVVERGSLICPLTVAGDAIAPPPDHTVRFDGMTPCDPSGRALDRLINATEHVDLGSGLSAEFMFSHKPHGGSYPDFYAKMTAYARILWTQAAAVDPSATPLTFRVREEGVDRSPFLYEDTASARAGIGAATDRLRTARAAVVGLGGTGSFLLDLLSKTPVDEIHLFDGDRLLTHNAFRAPGATSATMLNGAPNKADHWATTYRAMRTGVVAHPYHVDADNLNDLHGMSVVFLCMDSSLEKRAIVEHLEATGTFFVDTGIGAYLTSDHAIGGQVRVTAGLPGRPVSGEPWISFAERGPDVYADNIQVAELNALAAVLAVMRWKRWLKFYVDLEGEQHALYTISGNVLDLEDRP
jgi:hypothetical protein